jgi:sec-independent protein translocase protein TatC
LSTQKAPFTLHLEELRRRLVISFLSVTVAFLACFNYSETLYRWLVKPMKENLVLSLQEPYLSFVPREKVHELVFLAPAEAFWMHMKVSLIAGLVIAMPVVFWQAWAFMSPGLHKKEKKMAIPFVLVTSLLFLAGTAFCFIIVLPFAMNFLLNFRTESLTPMISVERYVDFCLKFILAFGVIFELPVVMVFLSRMGVVTPAWLASNRKYAVLVAFIAAALLTPTPDAFNQTLMAVPIMVLYEGGIWSARLLGRRKPLEEKQDSGGPSVDEGSE